MEQIEQFDQGKTLPLEGVFKAIHGRVSRDPFSVSNQALVAFIMALVNEREFDLSRIEDMPDQEAQELAGAVLDYCLFDGMAEEQRQAIDAAFTPYDELAAPERRH
ncbi:MAG: hypothetical protein RBS14_01770 [Atribacterota bacterium]|jgi:hypothetical protein|nr:hypothetical protein [Atribacterota bacterium]